MIRKLTFEDIDQVALIHQRELTGFLSEIGVDFLRKFYQASLSNEEMFTLVEEKREEIRGFVCATINTANLYKKILRKDLFGFTIFFIKLLLTSPSKIIKIVKMLNYPGFSSSDPELLAIAVAKNFQKQGIGKKLFKATIKEFQKKRVKSFKVSVYDRLPANGFYLKMGCRKIISFPFLSEKMNYYIYKIDQKKLGVILLVYDSLYANPIFLPLFDNSKAEISAIVVSDCILHHKDDWESLVFLYKRHGLAYFIFKILDQLIYLVTDLKRYFPLRKKARLLWLASKYKIPIIKIRDINQKKSLQILAGFAPDLLISYFNQILKSEALSLPRIGCINVHPGYLPNYRGVASSFWAMLENNKFGGATVHYMESKLDKGDIIKREKVPISKEISLHRHNFLCCQTGGRLLIEAINKIYFKKIKGKKQGKGNYYSWPKSEEVRRFINLGYKLMKLEDLNLY